MCLMVCELLSVISRWESVNAVRLFLITSENHEHFHCGVPVILRHILSLLSLTAASSSSDVLSD